MPNRCYTLSSNYCNGSNGIQHKTAKRGGYNQIVKCTLGYHSNSANATENTRSFLTTWRLFSIVPLQTENCDLLCKLNLRAALDMASEWQCSGADNGHCEVKQTAKTTLKDADIPSSISASLPYDSPFHELLVTVTFNLNARLWDNSPLKRKPSAME
ncbi:hypothetical protein QQP08_020277 [Theobroma cacao]|nr:hypothetical protein QQP08_020277 [Theobroma cacao]